MKLVIFFGLIILSINCQGQKKIEKINYPDGNLILYWESTDLESKRLVLYSVDEQKEYEIPADKIDGFPKLAAFSPDGTQILFKDPNNSDVIHIFNLKESDWDFKILPPLNYPEEGRYFYYDYIDDTTVVFKGLKNLFVISLNTNKLHDRIPFNDTFFVWAVDIIPEKNILSLSFYDRRLTLNNIIVNTIQYNYKTRLYNLYYKDTGKLYQWIPGTDYLFMMDSIAIKFNYITGEKETLNFSDINYTINFPDSRFINSNNMILLLSNQNSQFENNFYWYNFEDGSLKQITNTKTEKNLIDIYINDAK